jgi:beta-glucosidase/6-phospho-beta-glucosidase/beta-galactosidase
MYGSRTKRFSHPVVAAKLGDRVRFWLTHNEPWCIATLAPHRYFNRPRASHTPQNAPTSPSSPVFHDSSNAAK